METNPTKSAYQNMPFEEITSKDIGKTITTQARIEHITTPTPSMVTAVFECRSCMRLYEVDEKEVSPDIYEPAVCQECGGRSFKLLLNESKFQDTQELTISKVDTCKTLKVVLSDKATSYDRYFPNQEVEVEGQVKVRKNKNEFELYLDCCGIGIIGGSKPGR